MKLIKPSQNLSLHYWKEADRVAWRLVDDCTGRVIAYESPSECFTLEEALSKVEQYV